MITPIRWYCHYKEKTWHILTRCILNLLTQASAIPEMCLWHTQYKIGCVIRATLIPWVAVCHLCASTWYSLPVHRIWRLYLQLFQRYHNWQEASLLQRDCETVEVLSAAVGAVGEITLEKACSSEWRWRSLKVIGIASIPQAIYDFY